MSKIILGIDPGFATTGYGVIEVLENNKLRHVENGCIITKPKTPFSKRIEILYNEVEDILQEFKPSAIGVEELFFVKNVTTGIKVSHARGVILLAAQKNKVPLFECKPVEVKQAVAGYGGADKKQVQEMVRILLNLQSIPKPDDAADALAVAVCVANRV